MYAEITPHHLAALSVRRAADALEQSEAASNDLVLRHSRSASRFLLLLITALSGSASVSERVSKKRFGVAAGLISNAVGLPRTRPIVHLTSVATADDPVGGYTLMVSDTNRSVQVNSCGCGSLCELVHTGAEMVCAKV